MTDGTGEAEARRKPDNSAFISRVRTELAPIQVFFGREISRGGCKEQLKAYTLKSRGYKGPTSLDNELAFLLSNQALCKAGSFVIDPFCGSGSILVPCTVHGAKCQGSYISFDILNGKNINGRHQNILSNFDQYKLAYPDLVTMDFSSTGRSIRNTFNSVYDAIICDPPYGVRLVVLFFISSDSECKRG